MSDHELPRYRFRGNVKPSAEVSRPVAAYRNAASSGNAPAAAGSSATLDIFDVIDSWGGFWGISATDVDAALKKIGDVDTLYVRLNSPGGEASEGVAIANLLRAHPANVRVTVYGLAASAASYIAIAGDTVSMGPGSLMFVHDALNIVYGDAADLRKVADTLDTLSDSIASLYVLKAGGTTEQWRAAMHADTWYSAEAAVTAKLADRVGIDPQMPADLPPVEDDTEDEATVIEIDIEVSPAARAAARRFDLSMLPNAPAALAAPQTPAAASETPPTDPKEDGAMPDTENQGLRERLGLAKDADEATVLAKVDELLDKATKPDEASDEAIAKARNLKPEQVKAALDSATKPADDPKIPEGSVLVPQAYLDTLKDGAEAGKAALARQQREDRDNAIAKAQTDGKLSLAKAEVDKWSATWDRDPEGTAKWIEDLPLRFPVGKTSGYAGHDDSVGNSAKPFTDEEADQLGALAGLPKGVLR